MEIKIKLDTGNFNDLELDIYESISTLPIVVGNKMIIGNFLGFLYPNSNTFNQFPDELKRKLENRGANSFHIKKSIITVTELMSYNISIGNTKEEEINSGAVFNNFDEKSKVYKILCSCNFPYGSMLVHFQTSGEIFLEFDIEDIFFEEDNNYKIWYDLYMKEIDRIKAINTDKYNVFFENLYKNQLKI